MPGRVLGAVAVSTTYSSQQTRIAWLCVLRPTDLCAPCLWPFICRRRRGSPNTHVHSFIPELEGLGRQAQGLTCVHRDSHRNSCLPAPVCRSITGPQSDATGVPGPDLCRQIKCSFRQQWQETDSPPPVPGRGGDSWAPGN